MLYILNIVDLVKENPMYVILAVLALILLVILFCLVYSQNKVIIVNEENNKELNIDNVIENSSELIEEVSEHYEIQESKEESIIEDSFDIEDVTKSLECIPKERTIKLTNYEIEQEENAIISYDELITQAIPKLEISKELKEDIAPSVLEQKEENSNFDYEDNYLNNLKNLNKSLN